MTNILSTISGKFSTSLISSTFLPVTVFVIFFRLLIIPFNPSMLDSTLLAPLKALDEKWEIFVISLVAVVLSSLLDNLNIPHVRFYEGYPWLDTWIGYKKKRRYQAELDALNERKARLLKLYEALESQERASEAANSSPSAPGAAVDLLQKRMDALDNLLNEIERRINTEFPKKISILPTRLGNVIRSFENYPQWQYQMAAITIWPRLIAIIGKEYAATIDEAKSKFDFMLNAATLSALLAVFLLLAGSIFPLSLPLQWLWLLFQIVFFTLLARWFYKESIDRAGAWGLLVKGAFDLYRWELLKQLGYSHTLTSVQEERSLWRHISERLIYGDPVDRGQFITYTPAPKPSPTSAESDTEVPLEILRGVASATFDGAIQVTIEVRNIDPQKRSAEGVVITDTVPEGFDYQWNSVKASKGSASIVGINPYQFRFSDILNIGDTIQLSYIIVPRSRSAVNRIYRDITGGNYEG